MLNRFDAQSIKTELEKLRGISRELKRIIEKIEKIIRRASQ
jgi:hypothetical protein